MTPDADAGWTATVVCPFCGWDAEVSGDTIDEVNVFLTRIIRDHVRERHVGRKVEVIREVVS